MPLPAEASRFRYSLVINDQQGRTFARASSKEFSIGPGTHTAKPTTASVDLLISISGSGTVVITPLGIRCGQALGIVCVARLPLGTDISLLAVAAPGSTFAGWGGLCQGKVAACSVRLDRPTEITAVFGVSGGRYQVTSCGSIIDRSTGVEWFVGPDSETTWDAAVKWVAKLRACGDAWKLPTDAQLMRLYLPRSSAGTGYVKNGKHFPARLDPVFRGIGHGSWVWTSRSVDAFRAIAVNLYENIDVVLQKNQMQFTVRAFAVRRTRS